MGLSEEPGICHNFRSKSEENESIVTLAGLLQGAVRARVTTAVVHNKMLEREGCGAEERCAVTSVTQHNSLMARVKSLRRDNYFSTENWILVALGLAS